MKSCVIETIRGIPQICFDGEPVGMTIPYTYPRFMSDFAKLGIHLYRFSLPTGWVGPNKYDFSETDRILGEAFKADPEGYFLPLIWYGGPEEATWRPFLYPEEQTMSKDYQTGEPNLKMPKALAEEKIRQMSLRERYHFYEKYHASPRSYVSFAASGWRKAACGAAAALVKHLDETPFGERIFGFYVCGGHSYEWIAWGAYERDGFCDYSYCMQERFREWLRKNYANDIERLRQAWSNPGIDFESARVPLPEKRLAKPEWILRDPLHFQDVADYLTCFSETVATAAIDICRAIKKASSRKRITGVFYGYLLNHHGRFSPQHAGHLALKKVLESADIDFIASPYDYHFRGLGGVNTSQTLPASAINHGKAYINSVDAKTVLMPKGHFASVRAPRNWEDNSALLTRDFAAALTGGFNMSWVDLHGGNFSGPHTGEILSKLQRIEVDARKHNRKPCAEVAMVISAESLKFLYPDAYLTGLAICVQKQYGLGGLGAPFDTILDSDILTGQARNYKMYLFANQFYVEAGQVKRLRGILARQKALSLWIYAPGCISSEGFHPEKAAELCGINLKEESKLPDSLQVIVEGGEHPWQQGIPSGLVYGFDLDSRLRRESFGYEYESGREAVQPVLVAQESGGVVMGRIKGTDLRGLVAIEMDGNISVFSIAPAIPAELLRHFARLAGVHLYLENGDLVYAGGEYLAVYARGTGKRCVQLREKAKVTDLLLDKELSCETDKVWLNLAVNRCVLLHLEKA